MKLNEIKQKYQNDFDIKEENGALIIKEKAVDVDKMITEVLLKQKTNYWIDTDSEIIFSDENINYNKIDADNYYNQGTQAEIESDLLFSKLRLLAKHDSLNGDWKPQFKDNVWGFAYLNDNTGVDITNFNYRYQRGIFFKSEAAIMKAYQLFGHANILKMLKNGN